MICVICNSKIDKKLDRWIWLRDYNGKKFEGEVFYHLRCWKNKDEEFDRRCKQKVNEGIQEAMKVMENITGKKEEYILQ